MRIILFNFFFLKRRIEKHIFLTARLICLLALVSLLLIPADIYSNTMNVKELNQQGKTVTGVVVDDLGAPIIGVSVVVKATTTGVMTDVDGKYKITVADENAVLVFSFIGFTTKEIRVGSQHVIDVTLGEDAQLLDEVIVVSYGTQKKSKVTGAISNLKADALADLPVGQVGQKLQGQIAGVQVNQASGIPGQGMGFRIRGAASIGSSSQPLIVLDGMPFSTGLNNINPDEIESFSVLKDAAATSLYGSRAANGVILITTKRGKAGKTTVTLNASYGIQTTVSGTEKDIMNGHEFAQFKKEFYEDAIKFGDRNASEGVPERYQNPEQYGEGTKWYDLMTRTGTIQSYSLGISGGTENLNTMSTIGYFKQKGVVLSSEFERMTLRSNNDYKVNNWIKIGLNLSPMLQLYSNPNTDGDRQILSGAMIADPSQTPYDEDGNLKLSLISPGMFNQVNWVRRVKEYKDKYRVFTLLSNAFAEVNIWDGIKYRLQLGIDLGNRQQRVWTPSTSAGSWASAPPGKPSGSYNTEFYYNWNAENLFSYDKTFGEHSLGLLAGYSAQEYHWERGALNGSDYPDDLVEWVHAATTRTGDTGVTGWTVASYIGRVDYSFKNRYMLQGNFRRDGSSRFGAGNKWANFPSASVGWLVSDEGFMKPLYKTMNYLKLRASYGITGNYNFGNYEHITRIVNSNYIFDGSIAPGRVAENIGNEKLTWEETKQFDLGLDFGFLNDRIFFMYDYYTKKTDGMLYQIDIPWSSGFSNIKANLGSFKSWGHELTLESRNLVGEFAWKTNLNVTIPRNKVLALSTNNTPIGGYDEWGEFNRLEVGQPIGVFMGYISDGVYMNQAEFDSQPKYSSSQVGSARMKDISGPNGVPDGIIDKNDRTIIGDPNPDVTFGITNEFKWKDFDMSILLTGQFGGDIFMAAYQNTLNLDGVFNVLKVAKDRWRPDNPGNGKIPSTQKGTTELSRANQSDWVYSATHLAIKNITLGYNIPLKSSKYISKARVYFSAQQLAVFSNYPGTNPEISTNNELSWNGMGVDRTTYPIPRTFSLGCNITF